MRDIEKNKYINTVILKIASQCNLNCTYCYIYNHADKSYMSKSKFMSDEIFLQSCLKINEYYEENNLNQFTIVLHGGEPTLFNAEKLNMLLLNKMYPLVKTVIN